MNKSIQKDDNSLNHPKKRPPYPPPSRPVNHKAKLMRPTLPPPKPPYNQMSKGILEIDQLLADIDQLDLNKYHFNKSTQTGDNNHLTNEQQSFKDLIIAIRENELATVEEIINKSNNPNNLINLPVGANGYTPLMEAVQYNCNNEDDTKVAKLLIEQGADLETQNCFEQTALALAVKLNKYNIIKLLLSKNAKYEFHDDKIIIIADNPVYITDEEVRAIFPVVNFKQEPNLIFWKQLQDYKIKLDELNEIVNKKQENIIKTQKNIPDHDDDGCISQDLFKLKQEFKYLHKTLDNSLAQKDNLIEGLSQHLKGYKQEQKQRIN